MWKYLKLMYPEAVGHVVTVLCHLSLSRQCLSVLLSHQVPRECDEQVLLGELLRRKDLSVLLDV